jgi:hypothetical protein
MSKKALTALVPVVIIAALMALPSVAQATQFQCGSSECANGALIKGQASGLKLTFQEYAFTVNTFECPSAEAQGEVTKNQGSTVEAQITSFKFPLPPNPSCESPGEFGAREDIETNAGKPGEDWTLQVQQPDPTGSYEARIDPSSGKKLQFTAQLQLGLTSIVTCHYAADSIRLTGSAQNDTLTIDKTNSKFTLEGRQGFYGAQCGIVGSAVAHLEGSIQLETHANAQPVVVHMADGP